jgi:hypothetical protein
MERDCQILMYKDLSFRGLVQLNLRFDETKPDLFSHCRVKSKEAHHGD